MLFHFWNLEINSYTLLNDIAPLQDNSPTRRGAISYAVNGVIIKTFFFFCRNYCLVVFKIFCFFKDADFLLGTLAPTAERYKKIDYTTFFINSPSGLLIPFPEPSVNIAAVIQPFSIKVLN